MKILIVYKKVFIFYLFYLLFLLDILFNFKWWWNGVMWKICFLILVFFLVYLKYVICNIIEDVLKI